MKEENMKLTVYSQGFKRQLAAILALTGALALTACGGGASNSTNPNLTGGSGGSTYSGPAPANADVQSFRVQLWENIRGDNRCGSCHDVGGQGSAFFANNSNINDAYTVANTLVNLSDPATSRLVTKFTGTGHFCWESSQSACATQLEIWITNWANDRNGAGGREIQLTAPADENPSPAMSFPTAVPAAYYSGNSGVNIHTIVQTHCSGCHVPNATLGAPQQPYFAVSDNQLSYDTARGVPLITLSANTETRKQSRLYTRLATDGHRCWEATPGNGVSCSESAAVMLNAINYFIDNGIPAPDTSELSTMISSKAVSLFEDGIVASGGNRYEASQIAYYEFKLGSGDTILDRSGVSPAMNLTLNGVEGTDYEWLGSWGVKFNTDNAKAQASTSTSQKLYNMISSTGEYTIEAWVIPGNVAQEDANIVSYSGGPDTRNFTLGQQMYNYEVYNRNTSLTTDSNGMPLLSTDDSGLEVAQAAQQHVVVTYDPTNGRRIYVNGNLVPGIPDSVEAAGLTNWNSSYALVLGNEISLNRPWQGTIRLLAVHNRALSSDQIKQNFDVGVGQKFFLLFNVSQHLSGFNCQGPGGESYCFIVMEVAQFDNYSFLFNSPKFISLNDSAATPAGIRIKGMRIGINGREVSNGQAYAGLDVCVNGTCAPTNAAYVTGTGAQLSTIGTIVALQNGPNPAIGSGLSPDQLFLTFEQLGNAVPSKSYVENFPTTPDLIVPASVSDVMLHTFEQINASLATMTDVARTNTAINRNSDIDGGNADTNGTYTKVVQGMPSAPEVTGFVPAQQMSITQLAISYCNELVDGNGTTAPGTFFPSITFSATQPTLAFASDAERDLVIDPLLARLINKDASAADLTNMPDPATVKTVLRNLMDQLNDTDCNASACTVTRAKTIIKSTCAAAMASAPMLLQ